MAILTGVQHRFALTSALSLHLQEVLGTDGQLEQYAVVARNWFFNAGA